jgi:sugar-specific transcriptional regulator TrmB
MAQRDDAVVEVELVDSLTELGLTEYEARTLVDLTRLGTGTARDIAEMGEVPRTRVYDAVETLHEMGLVDVHHTTPRKFTVVSDETVVRKLQLDREQLIARVSGLFDELGTTEPQHEEAGVWTVTGQEAIAQRVLRFIDEADDQLVFMTVDELLTDAHLERLVAADERGVDLYVAGVSDGVQARIEEAVPSATLFETLWEWADSPAGTLLIVDEQTALVSVRLDERQSAVDDSREETAIWGSGQYNSLVVVLRAIFTWRLDAVDLAGDAE